MKKLILSLSFLLSFPLFASVWSVNQDHSRIGFTVPYMNVSEIEGRFNEFDGTAEIDDQGKPKNLSVEIKSRSIDTGNKMRDGHLKDHDFLQSDFHPVITFKSSDITQLKNGQYSAKGLLVIKNISKPAEFLFTLSDKVNDTWGYENRFVKFSSIIQRKDYKISWNKTLDGKEFLVGDSVKIAGTFQIQPQSSMTPKSKHMIPDTDQIRERDLDRQKNESGFSKKLRSFINGK